MGKPGEAASRGGSRFRPFTQGHWMGLLAAMLILHAYAPLASADDGIHQGVGRGGRLAEMHEIQDPEGIPQEWIQEILENQELLEGMEMLEMIAKSL